MQLDYSRLNGEYLNWAIENGDGRNADDLRFGQYLWSKYENMNEFKTDVFHVESCETTYSILLKELYTQEQWKNYYKKSHGEPAGGILNSTY